MFQNALEDFQHIVAEIERAATDLKQSRDVSSQEQILTELKALRIRAFKILQVLKPQLDAVNRALAQANMAGLRSGKLGALRLPRRPSSGE
jgi:hypothetical protein